VLDKSVAVREELSLNDELLFDARLFDSLSSRGQCIADEETESAVSFTLDG
jgi:hypothetical protein